MKSYDKDNAPIYNKRWDSHTSGSMVERSIFARSSFGLDCFGDNTQNVLEKRNDIEDILVTVTSMPKYLYWKVIIYSCQQKLPLSTYFDKVIKISGNLYKITLSVIYCTKLV